MVYVENFVIYQKQWVAVYFECKSLTLFLTIKGLERDVSVAEKQQPGICEPLCMVVQPGDGLASNTGRLTRKWESGK